MPKYNKVLTYEKIYTNPMWAPQVRNIALKALAIGLVVGFLLGVYTTAKSKGKDFTVPTPQITVTKTVHPKHSN